MKLEALEPRLLLTAATDDQCMRIMDILSTYDAPFMPGTTLADIVESQAEAQNRDVIDFLQDDSSKNGIGADIDSTNTVTLDFSPSVFNKKITVKGGNLGPLNNVSAPVKITGSDHKHIKFNYNTGRELNGEIAIKVNKNDILGSPNFGFLGTKGVIGDIDLVANMNNDEVTFRETTASSLVLALDKNIIDGIPDSISLNFESATNGFTVLPANSEFDPNEFLSITSISCRAGKGFKRMVR